MHTYDVKSERFGTIQVRAESLEEARNWAREALDIKDSSAVTLHRDCVRCDRCDSAPCTCAREVAS
jgi:hypothetical protein